MKYLCLVYYDEAKVDALPRSNDDAIMCDVRECREELRKTGYYIGSSPLQLVEPTTTIRIRNGMISIADGPFAETKEQLGGFYLIDARDLNDAIRLASRTPPGSPWLHRDLANSGGG